MTSYRLTLAAQQDIREIRIYSKAMFGPDTAKAYLLGLREKFALLRRSPLAGAPQDDLRPGPRGLFYRSHRIYYVLQDDQLLIIRVLHHAQDAARHIAP